MIDRIAHIYTEKYDYDENGLLHCILRAGNKMDTIKSFKYDDNGNQIESKTGYRTIIREFENGLLIQKIKSEGDAEDRISEFKYDSLDRPTVEDWVFSGDHQMKTRFEYYDNGKLFRETDVQGKSPNTLTEYRNEYKYDENDSILEITKYGRIKRESTFFISGRKTFERRLERKLWATPIIKYSGFCAQVSTLLSTQFSTRWIENCEFKPLNFMLENRWHQLNNQYKS